MVNEKCRGCGTELLPPRYKYDNGYCRGCYKEARVKKIDGGDSCPVCQGKIINKGVWKTAERKEMIFREIKCSKCLKVFRRIGQDNFSSKPLKGE